MNSSRLYEKRFIFAFLVLTVSIGVIVAVSYFMAQEEQAVAVERRLLNDEMDKIEVFVTSAKITIGYWECYHVAKSNESTSSICNQSREHFKNQTATQLLITQGLYPGHPKLAGLRPSWRVFNWYFHSYILFIKADLNAPTPQLNKLLDESNTHIDRLFTILRNEELTPSEYSWIEKEEISKNAKLLRVMLTALRYDHNPSIANRKTAIDAFEAYCSLNDKSKCKNIYVDDNLHQDRLAKPIFDVWLTKINDEHER